MVVQGVMPLRQQWHWNLTVNPLLPFLSGTNEPSRHSSQRWQTAVTLRQGRFKLVNGDSLGLWILLHRWLSHAFGTFPWRVSVELNFIMWLAIMSGPVPLGALLSVCQTRLHTFYHETLSLQNYYDVKITVPCCYFWLRKAVQSLSYFLVRVTVRCHHF